jgi:hypothetical protein
MAIRVIIAIFAHYLCKFGYASLIFSKKTNGEFSKTHNLAFGEFGKFGWFLS